MNVFAYTLPLRRVLKHIRTWFDYADLTATFATDAEGKPIPQEMQDRLRRFYTLYWQACMPGPTGFLAMQEIKKMHLEDCAALAERIAEEG